MNLEKMLADLIQKIERRFYGKYRGLVVDNADPQKLGRLKVKVPAVLGSEVVTGWAMPCVAYGGMADTGLFCIPEIDAGVWVEFEEGDPEYPIWSGTFWSEPDGSEAPTPVDAEGSAEEEVQDPPTRKIFKTVKGHTIQLEDGDGDEMIIIHDGVNGHRVVMNADGVKVTDGQQAHEITLSADGVLIHDGANSQDVVMDASGIAITDKNSNSITMDAQGLHCQDGNGNTLNMDAMSGAAGPGAAFHSGSHRVCLDGLITWLLSHQHVGNMGAPTPLFPASIVDLTVAQSPAPTGILSTKIKVE